MIEAVGRKMNTTHDGGKLFFDYMSKHTIKSTTTLLAYFEKYKKIVRDHAEKKRPEYDGLQIEEQNYYELYTLFPELFTTPFPCPDKPSFTYIDLFSGIGGFHQAMEKLGGKCVFASEIDADAIHTYKENYGIDSAHDITKTKEDDIPKHDVLCAGFPCQAFSKAGQQLGFADKTKGTLFFEIVRILKYHKTPYIILENVRNLTSHDGGKTWDVIKNALKELGYIISEEPFIISPHQLGIPQFRERVYVLGVRKELYDGDLSFAVHSLLKLGFDTMNSKILEDVVDPKYNISRHEEAVLNCWDEFHKGIKEKVLGFPVWSSEFGAEYDLSDMPAWKAGFCYKNRALFESNKTFIKSWLKKWNFLSEFTPTERKFEWQAGESIESLWDGFIQFRPSGIRVKKPDFFPALVAMVQIPIIGRLKRRLTPREAARLQSFPDEFIPNPNDHQAYKQFGNAVNVNCVKFLAEQLFRFGKESDGARIVETLL